MEKKDESSHQDTNDFCWEAQYKIAGWKKSLGKWQRARNTLAWCAQAEKHLLPLVMPSAKI